MDAEREAREIARKVLGGPPEDEADQFLEDEATADIAAALRRAHAAGRREAVEECAKVAENSGAYSGTVIAHEIRALAAEPKADATLRERAGEQKEGEG